MTIPPQSGLFVPETQLEGLLQNNPRVPGLTAGILLNAVLAHSELVLWGIDAKGDFIFSQGAGLRSIGVADNEVVGVNVFEMYADFPEVLAGIRESLAGKQQHVKTETHDAVFESWYCPINDQAGNTCGLMGISTLTTELETTKKELRDATEYFQIAFEKSPILMAILTFDERSVIDVNEKFLEVTGYQREQLIGRRMADLGFCGEAFVTVDSQATRADAFYDQEIHVLTEAGEELLLIATGAKFQYRAQECLLVFARDATRESQTAVQLRRSQQLWTTLAMQDTVGIFRCNAAGEIVYANRFFWSCFGLTETESGVLTRLQNSQPVPIPAWYALFESDSHIDLKTKWNEIASGQLHFQAELQLVGDERTVEWAQVRIDPVSQEDDVFIGSLVNVTAIKQAQAQLRVENYQLGQAVQKRTLQLEKMNTSLRKAIEQSKLATSQLEVYKEKLEAVVSNAVDFIVQIDPDETISYINRVDPALSVDEVLHSNVAHWFSDEHRAAGIEQVRKMLRGNESINFETPLRYPDGREIWYSVRGAPIHSEGEIIGASIVARDISRQRELEQEARQKLEQVSHLSRLTLMGEMTASFSHELKHPLFSINLAAGACRHRIENNNLSEAQLLENLADIEELSHNAGQLLQRMRTFTSNRPSDRVRFPTQSLLDESMKIIGPVVRDSKVVIEIDCEPNLSDCFVDPILIQQVLVNLIVNGIEAAQQSCKSTMPRVHIQAQQSADTQISITVTDTGDGIDPDILPEIFEAFKTSKENGLGMGLAISRGIIENHQGVLKVNQTGPDGTTMQLLLPADP